VPPVHWLVAMDVGALPLVSKNLLYAIVAFDEAAASAPSIALAWESPCISMDLGTATAAQLHAMRQALHQIRLLQ